jgi:hypothetical protein
MIAPLDLAPDDLIERRLLWRAFGPHGWFGGPHPAIAVDQLPPGIEQGDTHRQATKDGVRLPLRGGGLVARALEFELALSQFGDVAVDAQRVAVAQRHERKLDVATSGDRAFRTAAVGVEGSCDALL